MSKVLIVIDMQNDFVTGSLGSDMAQAIVPKVVEKIEKKDYNSLIFTRDTHLSDYMNTLEGKKLPVSHCIKGTDGWDIIPEIVESLSLKDIQGLLVDKVTFGYSGWEETLSFEDFEEIEIVGLCTDICVVSNALILRALYPNMKITVDSSCCAGTSIEAHNSTLQVMKSFVKPIRKICKLEEIVTIFNTVNVYKFSDNESYIMYFDVYKLKGTEYEGLYKALCSNDIIPM